MRKNKREETTPASPSTAILVGTAHPFRGGIAYFNQELAKNLRKNDIRTEIQTFTVQYPKFLFPGQSQYSDEPPPPGIDIVRTVNSVNPFNWIRTGRAIRRRKPDMVVIKYWIPLMAPCLGTICRIARMNGHTRILAVADNIVPHEKRALDRTLTRYLIGSVDGFICMSEEVRSDLRKFDQSKPALFSPHPLYDYGEPVEKKEALRELGLDERHRYVLFFGFVREYKGLDLLIRAAGLLKKNGRLDDLRFIVAGEYYSDKEKYLDLIRENGVAEEMILFDRFIPDSQVRYFFSAADLVVQPYKTATQSGVTQIAYHFDVPVVVTDVGGLAEIVPDGKVGYVTDREPEAIARAIRTFFDGEKAEEFRRNIREEKKRFSWDAMTGRLKELFQTVSTSKN